MTKQVNDQNVSTPPMREALVPSQPPLAPRAPSSIPHVGPRGIIKEGEPRWWKRFWQDRVSRD